MKNYLLIIFCLIFCLGVKAQNNAKQLLSSSMADTWVATDAMGRPLITDAREGHIRKDKYVGIFYFIWQGAHGYDHNEKPDTDEGVKAKISNDLKSPYDITTILAADSKAPKYGPLGSWILNGPITSGPGTPCSG